MMNLSFSTVGVVVGRFQPFHGGHRKLVETALAANDGVVVIIGSARSARSLRNPWIASERRDFIDANLDPQHRSRVLFIEVPDRFDDEAVWIKSVIDSVTSIAPNARRFTHYNLADEKWFTNWDFKKVEGFSNVSQKSIRENFFRDASSVNSDLNLAEATKKFLTRFATTPEYQRLVEEQRAIDKYKDAWSESPFEPVFVTTDALVIQAGRMILIKRKKAPGKDLWAIPGGFLDPRELIFDCSLRELREETKIEVPDASLRRAFSHARTFDHPLRSSRGRTITHAHLFELPGDSTAKIEANDDAADARWFPLEQIEKMEPEFFEDHFHIIRSFLLAASTRR